MEHPSDHSIYFKMLCREVQICKTVCLTAGHTPLFVSQEKTYKSVGFSSEFVLKHFATLIGN